MNIRKIIFVQSVLDDELLSNWFEEHPGFSNEQIFFVMITNYQDPSSIVNDTLISVRKYPHLNSKEILVVYAGENTHSLCNHLNTHALDLCLLKDGLIKTFRGFSNPHKKKLFPWILSGEIINSLNR